MVDRNQNADEMIHMVRNDNIMIENNLTAIVERIMTQNGLNTGFRRPNYTSPIANFIVQTELPRGAKVPKFTKFAGDTSESTVGHIARYLTEAGDLANDENLRIKYFPSSLTKNAFTWFTTLPPGSIDAWTHLERLFHEQFYMGQSKIIPELELVEMAAGGLDYSIRKKLDTQDMIQKAIKEGRSKFADKPKLKVDSDPLDVSNTNYTEPVCMGDVNMVEVRDHAEIPTVEVKEDVEGALREDEYYVLVEVPKEKDSNLSTEATEGQKIPEEELTQATEGLRKEFEKVQIAEEKIEPINIEGSKKEFE
ncbi:uncharacterized protein LOC131636100 [Vicia villosa]|uniref:uncharacterized protein LOC131636100 n=1 Tax=Vicia villosa TaxID=3911 RepID=UPI00273AE224|nr:uncharacterized protein LOC131636100 [Vicia villosa]